MNDDRSQPTESPPELTHAHHGRGLLARAIRRYPELPYVAPFFVYLICVAAEGWISDPFYRLHSYALRSIIGLVVAIVFWKHFPPFGRLHPLKCIVFGLSVAYGWVIIHRMVAGQYVDGAWLTTRQAWYFQPIGHDADPSDYFDPRAVYGSGVMYWMFLVVRIAGASITVPIVEELFWRAFLLRALIDWEAFDRVPLARFTWKSFLICSLLSAAEHPQWEVGILCWMVYNGLFYWTRSLLCLIVTHGITNFALYAHVAVHRDWVFWS